MLHPVQIKGYTDLDAADDRLRAAFAKLDIPEVASDRVRTRAHRDFLRLMLEYDDLVKKSNGDARAELPQLSNSQDTSNFIFTQNINRELTLLVKAIIQPSAYIRHMRAEFETERLLRLPLAKQINRFQTILRTLDEVLKRTSVANRALTVVPFQASEQKKLKAIFASSERAIETLKTRRQQLVYDGIVLPTNFLYGLMSGLGPAGSFYKALEMIVTETGSGFNPLWFVLPSLVIAQGAGKSNFNMSVRNIEPMVATSFGAMCQQLVVRREGSDPELIVESITNCSKFILAATTVLFSIFAASIFFQLTLQTLAEFRDWIFNDPSIIYAIVAMVSCVAMFLTLASVFTIAYANYIRNPLKIILPFEAPVFTTAAVVFSRLSHSCKVSAKNAALFVFALLAFAMQVSCIWGTIQLMFKSGGPGLNLFYNHPDFIMAEDIVELEGQNDNSIKVDGLPVGIHIVQGNGFLGILPFFSSAATVIAARFALAIIGNIFNFFNDLLNARLYELGSGLLFGGLKLILFPFVMVIMSLLELVRDTMKIVVFPVCKIMDRCFGTGSADAFLYILDSLQATLYQGMPSFLQDILDAVAVWGPSVINGLANGGLSVKALVTSVITGTEYLDNVALQLLLGFVSAGINSFNCVAAAIPLQADTREEQRQAENADVIGPTRKDTNWSEPVREENAHQAWLSRGSVYGNPNSSKLTHSSFFANVTRPQSVKGCVNTAALCSTDPNHFGYVL